MREKCMRWVEERAYRGLVVPAADDEGATAAAADEDGCVVTW